MLVPLSFQTGDAFATSGEDNHVPSIQKRLEIRHRCVLASSFSASKRYSPTNSRHALCCMPTSRPRSENLYIVSTRYQERVRFSYQPQSCGRSSCASCPYDASNLGDCRCYRVYDPKIASPTSQIPCDVYSIPFITQCIVLHAVDKRVWRTIWKVFRRVVLVAVGGSRVTLSCFRRYLSCKSVTDSNVLLVSIAAQCMEGLLERS
jgi:hypothetical protein